MSPPITLPKARLGDPSPGHILNLNACCSMHSVEAGTHECMWGVLPEVGFWPSEQTCIFLDWDDTLLCTSFINAVPDGELTPAEEMEMQQLGLSVARLLQLAGRLGLVFIITNAGEGWVEQSAAEFLPHVVPVLNEVPVVSARARFEMFYPDDGFMWKKHAFLDVLQRHLDVGTAANLISVGDSLCEMQAVKTLAREFAKASVKTVHFVPSPTLSELTQQLQCLIEELQCIIGSPLNFDIDMSRCHSQGGFKITVPLSSKLPSR